MIKASLVRKGICDLSFLYFGLLVIVPLATSHSSRGTHRKSSCLAIDASAAINDICGYESNVGR